MTRDLAVTRMADLCLQDCTGLTPAVMTEISGISSIRELGHENWEAVYVGATADVA
jgi:hypothetical protein